MTSPSAFIDPMAFALPFGGAALDVGAINLDAAGDWLGPIELPAFPLIGVGGAHHPIAAQLDCVVDSPDALEALLANVRAQPAAAAIAVQTLRVLEHMPVPQGLIVESLAYAALQASDAHLAWREARGAAPSLPPGQVIVKRGDDDLTITLDRPDAHNAIDRSMRDALREAFEFAALDDGIARIMLRSKGRAFSVGADLAEFGTTRDPATAHSIRTQTLPAHAIARCAERLHVHVQGACVGSALEMAAFANRITASPRAWFQLPELAMGIIPGAGGCVSVPRRIGRQRATWMLLSGRRVDARTALDWGLIDAIIDD